MCAQIEACSTANDIIKSVNVLHAIRWVAQGWEKVSSTTIQKCFRKAGILDHDFSVIQRASALDHDPFEDLDEESDTADLQALITQVQQENACSVEEFIDGDQELQTCVNIHGDEWSAEFLNSLPGPSPNTPNSDAAPAGIEEIAEEQEEEEESCEPKLKGFKEAIQSMEDVLCFLDHRGCTIEANQASQLLDSELICFVLNLNIGNNHM